MMRMATAFLLLQLATGTELEHFIVGGRNLLEGKSPAVKSRSLSRRPPSLIPSAKPKHSPAAKVSHSRRPHDDGDLDDFPDHSIHDDDFGELHHKDATEEDDDVIYNPKNNNQEPSKVTGTQKVENNVNQKDNQNDNKVGKKDSPHRSPAKPSPPKASPPKASPPKASPPKASPPKASPPKTPKASPPKATPKKNKNEGGKKNGGKEAESTTIVNAASSESSSSSLAVVLPAVIIPTVVLAAIAAIVGYTKWLKHTTTEKALELDAEAGALIVDSPFMHNTPADAHDTEVSL